MVYHTWQPQLNRFLFSFSWDFWFLFTRTKSTWPINCNIISICNYHVRECRYTRFIEIIKPIDRFHLWQRSATEIRKFPLQIIINRSNVKTSIMLIECLCDAWNLYDRKLNARHGPNKSFTSIVISIRNYPSVHSKWYISLSHVKHRAQYTVHTHKIDETNDTSLVPNNLKSAGILFEFILGIGRSFELLV